ncbi:MAG: hypothetical protein N4A41_03130 [Crocinitomicaceae bacterium]|jgi:hypothetical protein|nr:hypothetical protein [Crocinitomicaceae bacterium]
MRTIKNILAILFIGGGSILIAKLDHENSVYYPYTVTYLNVLFAIFAFNIIARKNYRFKNYFTSVFNIFSEKITYEIESELPFEVLKENLKEILVQNKATIRYESEDKIFATTKMTFKSWGENIYVDIWKNGNTTKVKFISVCLFQMYSWGKNEANLKRLISSYEASLTV